MRLWLDAHREPEVSWVWAKTARCAIALLRGGCVEKISFAPDQHPLVVEVLDWMIEHGARADRAVHKHGAGVRFPRGLLRVSYPPDAP
jgi:hypothetical protein